MPNKKSRRNVSRRKSRRNVSRRKSRHDIHKYPPDDMIMLMFGGGKNILREFTDEKTFRRHGRRPYEIWEFRFCACAQHPPLRTAKKTKSSYFIIKPQPGS